jgi:hypothetical protein
LESEELAQPLSRLGAGIGEDRGCDQPTIDAKSPCILPRHCISCFGQIPYVRLSLAFQDTMLRVECGDADRVADWSWRELADRFPGSLLAPKCQHLWLFCKHVEKKDEVLALLI